MKDKEKKSYIILGIGIGIVITNIIYYINPNVKFKEITDNEVIARAKDLGMVNVKENIKLESEEAKGSKDRKKEDKEKETFTNENKLIIEEGDNLSDIAEKLKNMGFIEDEKKFSNRVKERELSKSIRYGEYEIEKDADFDKIINIITWKDRK